MEYVSKLHSEGFSIYIVTSSHYSTVSNKFRDALFPYFPFIDYNHIIVCNAKQLVRGNVLIDDGVHNLLDSDTLKATYSKILFSANHNKYFDCDKTDIYRVHNWNEAYEIVERLYEDELEKESAKKE
jgi:5'(3')-deoxyribonucleotidase